MRIKDTLKNFHRLTSGYWWAMSVSMSWTASDSGLSRIAVIWLTQPRNIQHGTSEDYNVTNNNYVTKQLTETDQ